MMIKMIFYFQLAMKNVFCYGIFLKENAYFLLMKQNLQYILSLVDKLMGITCFSMENKMEN